MKTLIESNLNYPFKGRSNAQPKRKPLNRGPRIPFSACQLEELEKKFKDIHYLSSMEVTALAENLNLGESRVSPIKVFDNLSIAEDKLACIILCCNGSLFVLLSSLAFRLTKVVTSNPFT